MLDPIRCYLSIACVGVLVLIGVFSYRKVVQLVVTLKTSSIAKAFGFNKIIMIMFFDKYSVTTCIRYIFREVNRIEDAVLKDITSFPE